MIIADHIKKSFGTLVVLKDICFKADAAEVVSIVGASGAGKSSLLALMAGEITVSILDLVTLGPMLASGKIRLIGVTGAERTPLTPDIPTLVEQGFSGFELPTWAGFFAPKNTPVEVIQKLRDVSIKVMNMPDVLPRLKDLGYVAGGASTADFQKQLEQEKARWGRLIKDSGIEI